MNLSASRTAASPRQSVTWFTIEWVVIGLGAVWLTGCGWVNVDYHIAADGSVETDEDTESSTYPVTSTGGTMDVDSDGKMDTGADLDTDTDRDTVSGTGSGSAQDSDTATSPNTSADTAPITQAETENETETDPATPTEPESDTAVATDTSNVFASDIETETATATQSETATATGTDSDTTTDTSAITVPELTRGYWLLDAIDDNLVSWNDSTLLLEDAVVNPDGTVDMAARFDWFQEQEPKDVQIGTATYYPDTFTLVVISGSYTYQATYDENTDALIDGSWSLEGGTDTSTFTATRKHDGFRLDVSDAQATTQHNPNYGALKIVDETHYYYWSATRGEMTGQTITLFLGTPSTLSALRLLSYRFDTTYSPPTDVTIRCFDPSDQLITTVLHSFTESPVYQGIDLMVNEPVGSLEMDIDGVVYPAGDWLIIHEMDLFGGL